MKYAPSLIARWSLLTAFFMLILMIPFTAPVNAAVACLTTQAITAPGDDPYVEAIQLSGRSLIWLKQTAQEYEYTLWHYNIQTEVLTPLGIVHNEFSEYSAPPYLFDLDDDHVVWIDLASQVQLYTASTGQTTRLTDGTKLNTNPQIEGNSVLWRQGKNVDKLKKLMHYDIAAGTTTKIAKTFSYSLNEGRVLWTRSLYDIATGTTTALTEDYLTLLNGSHAVGTYLTAPYPDSPEYLAPQLAVKDLNTGTVTQITSNSFRTFIDRYTLNGDFVGWSEYYGLGYEHSFFLYQISTGEKRRLSLSPGGGWDGRIAINGRFVGFPDTGDEFFVYDTLSTSTTVILDETHSQSGFGDIDAGNIAWVGYNYSEDYDVVDTQLFLRTGCGSTATIIAQTPDLNILSGRSVTLSVTTTGDQPITYQWYQGEQGDTTAPVGDNLPTFTTPPLTETTSYWLHTSNPYGVEDSRTITLTVGSSAELVRDGGFEASPAYPASLNAWKISPDFAPVGRRCNQVNKPPVAHSGECAEHFKNVGYFAKETATQSLAAVPYQTGDTLTFSVWMKAENIAPEQVSILLKVRYDDQTTAKTVLRPTETQFEYTPLVADPITLTGTVERVQVQIKYRGLRGNWLLDDVSVLHQPANTLMSLPVPASELGPHH